MKKKKFNPELLKEEIGKFKFLTEYDFYQEKKEIPEYKDLILGYEQLEEADEAPSDLKPEDNANSAADKVAADLGVDAGDADGEESTSDIPEPDAPAPPPPPAPPTPPTGTEVPPLLPNPEYVAVGCNPIPTG